MSQTGADEELPSVDFVVGEPVDGRSGGPVVGPCATRVADVDVPQQPGDDDALPSRPGPRWGRRLLAVAVLALVVVAAVVHSAVERGAHPAQPAPSVAATSSAASSASGTSTPVVGTSRSVNVGEPVSPFLPSMPPCPSAGDAESACNTLRSVPAAFTAAVHAVFPHARQRSALSVQVRDSPPQSLPGVWSRTYVGRAGGVTVEVTVLALKLDQGIAGAEDDGTRTRVFSERSSGGKLVLVQAIGSSGHPPSLRRVEALARDRRLLSV